MPSSVQMLRGRRVVAVSHHESLSGDDLYTMRCGYSFALSCTGWNKALINLRKAKIKALASEFAANFRKLDEDMPQGAYVAIVEPRECDYDFCRLAKSVANTWTGSAVEVFQDERAALNWLNTFTDCTFSTRLATGRR